MNKKFNVIYEHCKEQHARAVVLYVDLAGQASNPYLYVDAEMTTKVEKDELFNLCLKNMVVVADTKTPDHFHYVVSFGTESNTTVVGIGDATFKSAEAVVEE